MRRLWLLGPASVEHLPETQRAAAHSAGHEQPAAVPRFRSQRTVALLGYLVAERRPVARGYLASLFWPDEAPSKGRSNLRRELYNLSQILPDCWQLNRQAVAFVPPPDLLIDLDTLRELAAAERWQEAAELLGGEYLEGLHLYDNLEFENWLLREREHWRGHAEAVLLRVIEGQSRRGHYSDALRHAQRLLQLAPWNEEAHRQAMRLLAWTGRRGDALRQHETCKRLLWEELGVEPSEETSALRQRIEAGALDLPPQLPAFLTEEEARHEVDRAHFVARERQLARLDGFLEQALAGYGRIVFITGSAGSGKTALLKAFGRRAMDAHPGLLVASGHCNAYSDVGDPYLPFRDLMAMLSGDVEAKWDAGSVTREHAQRIWAALPLVVQALLNHGPDVVDVIVPGAALLPRATVAAQGSAPWLARLSDLVGGQATHSQDVNRRFLFEQITAVLRAVAHERPLLLLLDDIQWADVASISLLFHLGRRLPDAHARILIACAYRPEEVAVSPPATGAARTERHSLALALSELKRLFGDVWVDLDQADAHAGRRFMDALLDAEPNRLGEGFRTGLFRRTEGHALFSVELLRAMQERGDLLQDEDGCWTEGPALDWTALPARVGAVIAERIDRLDPELQETLTVASVEGEAFTAQVVARVRETAERALLHRLSHDLERHHRLVREQEEMQTDQGRLSRYRFGHILFRDYVYNRLSPGERRLLHRDVAAALEALYSGLLDEMAVQLAYHHQEAGDVDGAFQYLTRAAERASRLYANEEAIAHYARAIALAERVCPDVVSLAKLHRGRALARERLGEFDQARQDHQAILRLARAADEPRVEWRAFLDLGKLWASRDYRRAGDYIEGALRLARRIDDPAVLARSLNWMGNWHANAADSRTAIGYHQEALEIVEKLGDGRDLANTLDLLGLAHLLRGDLAASSRYFGRSIALCRQRDDQARLVTGLIARAITVSVLAMLASVPASSPPDALRDFDEAMRIAEEIGSTSDQAWAHWALGLLHTVRGRFGEALETIGKGLEIACTVAHREYEVGNRFALGLLYTELLAPEEATRELENALGLARELGSQVWIYYMTAALAGACHQAGDLAGAEACLGMTLSPDTEMDTIGKRYCWARRAELALGQGDPALALDITERLIASAPGMSSGGVISFVWKLKAEALMAMGQTEAAQPLLQAAIHNAEAAGERFLLWRLHGSLGRLQRAAGRQSDAEMLFATARELVGELAHTVPAGELRDGFLRGAHETIGR